MILIDGVTFGLSLMATGILGLCVMAVLIHFFGNED